MEVFHSELGEYVMKQLLQGNSHSDNRSSLVAGCRDTLPILFGIATFGIIFGFTAVELGFTTFEVTVMSAVVFAGASQLAAVFLMAEGTHLAITALTVVMINARYVMYSATMAPYFQHFSRVRKAVYAFLLVDAPFALSIPRFQHSGPTPAHWYYLGSGVLLWFAWVVGTFVGAAMTLEVPDSFPVELVLPLVFIALLFPVVRDRPTALTAVVAALVATAAAPLDYNLGLLVGVAIGILAGVISKR